MVTCRLLSARNSTMSEVSSPFIDVLHEDLEYNSKQVISGLRFQILSLQTEKNLLQMSKDSLKQEYESIVSKKNQELQNLQENVEFLHKKREQLQSKLDNQTAIHDKTSSESSGSVTRLQRENIRLETDLSKLEQKYANVVAKYEHLRLDLNGELSANDELRERIKSLERDNQRLAQVNDELSGNLRLAGDQLHSDTRHVLQEQNDSLTRTNAQLQLKVDELLQKQTSVELLKQQNVSLLSKMARLEELEKKSWDLSIQNAELKVNFDDYFKLIYDTVAHSETDTSELVVRLFVAKFKELKNTRIVLYDKLTQAQSKLDAAEQRVHSLEARAAELEDKISSLEEANTAKDVTLKKLENQKSLNTQEIEFLRNSLKKFDQIARKDDVSEATNQYLTNLEKLVDEYKQKIDTLQKAQPSPVSNKRPRLMESPAPSPKLERENIELQIQLKSLADDVTRLEKLLESKDAVKHQRESFHILQYKSNPFHKDQLVKQQTLDVLRKENEALLKNMSDDVFPKAVFARQEHDKALLQAKIDELTKKINRLKSIYAEKSKEILSIISRFFGYTIEFIPSPVNPNDLTSRIKLVSKYLPENGYLVLDLKTKSLKAHGNSDFKSLCEDLVSEWVNDKGQIPCFLSALSLQVYNTSV